MARFFKIKIGDKWLTDTGLENGVQCLSEVSGASDLLTNYTGNTQTAIDGSPIIQIFEVGTKGRQIEIKIDTIYKSVWDDLIQIIYDSLTDETSINLKLFGDISNFDVEVLPLMPQPFQASEFVNGRIRNSIFRFITL